MAVFPRWADRLAGALGIPMRPELRRFLEAWQRCEGGTASFNPLNTTMHLAGSTRYNSAGVQHFADELVGLAATILTLRLAYYRQLVAAMRNPRFTAEQITEAGAAALETWGTGTECIKRVLAGK